MDFNCLKDICEIVHGLGEKLPRKDSVKLIQSILLKQMTLLIFKIQEAALLHNHCNITINHVLYVLLNHKVTLIRVLSYYLLKDNIQSINKLDATNEEKKKTNKRKLDLIDIKYFDKDFVENISNLDDKTYLDPITALTSIDFTTKDLSRDNIKSKSIFNNLRNSIADMKLKINVTDEDLKKSTESRIMRANDFSIVLSTEGYKGFEKCRSKSFHKNKLGELLLLSVHNALPCEITYNNQIKDILLFLAKETIHCLIDRVFENRKHTDSYDENNPINKKHKYRSMLVDEILAVVTAIWTTPVEDINYQYKEDDEFFKNQLIFDS